MNYDAYVQAIQEQVAIHSQQLTQLSQKSAPLSQLERTAAERSIQIVIEALIGSSKQLGKKHQLPARTNAYQALLQLAPVADFDDKTLAQLKGAIGMRNAIVHDYLNLNWDLIGRVIKDQEYLLIVDTVQLFCELLLAD